MVTISEAAKMMKLTKRSAHRRLEAIWERDVQAGTANWRFRLGTHATGPILINLDALRKLHPELFEQRYVSRQEFRLSVERLTKVESSYRTVSARVSALERNAKAPPT